MEPETAAAVPGAAIEESVAGGITFLLGCGGGMFIMLLVCGVSVFFNFYLLKSLFTVVKEGLTTISSLREAINDVLDENN